MSRSDPRHVKTQHEEPVREESDNNLVKVWFVYPMCNLISMTVEHKCNDCGRVVYQSSVLIQPTQRTFS